MYSKDFVIPLGLAAMLIFYPGPVWRFLTEKLRLPIPPRRSVVCGLMAVFFAALSILFYQTGLISDHSAWVISLVGAAGLKVIYWLGIQLAGYQNDDEIPW